MMKSLLNLRIIFLYLFTGISNIQYISRGQNSFGGGYEWLSSAVLVSAEIDGRRGRLNNNRKNNYLAGVLAESSSAGTDDDGKKRNARSGYGGYNPGRLNKWDDAHAYYASEAEIQRRVRRRARSREAALLESSATDVSRTTLGSSSSNRQAFDPQVGVRDGDGGGGGWFGAGGPGRGPSNWRPLQLSLPVVLSSLPTVHFRCDPLVNFKLKQRLELLGAAVTLGMDYLSDIQQWRSFCAIEDTVVRGRFSLRGSELGWAKSWLWNLGLGEDQSAKFKLRLGLNLKSYKAYAKLRFRTEPISPFDLGEGISCAGKLPLPVHLLPMLRSVPLRIEYILRINTERPNIMLRRHDPSKKIYVTTGIGSVDLSLDELNFCLEWDEKSPVWGVGLVKHSSGSTTAGSRGTDTTTSSSSNSGSSGSGMSSNGKKTNGGSGRSTSTRGSTGGVKKSTNGNNNNGGGGSSIGSSGGNSAKSSQRRQQSSTGSTRTSSTTTRGSSSTSSSASSGGSSGSSGVNSFDHRAYDAASIRTSTSRTPPPSAAPSSLSQRQY